MRSMKLSKWSTEHIWTFSVLLMKIIFIGSVLGKPQNQSDNIDGLLKDTFGPPPTQEPLNLGEPPTQEPQNLGDGCTCVPYYLCQNGTVNTDGDGLIDVKFSEDNPCNSLEKCCKTPIEKKDLVKPKPHGHRGCGFRNANGLGFRITGSQNEAQFGEFPWMIGILEKPEDKFKYRCGGALIHPQLVLTAAHCVIGKDPAKHNLHARAGEWDTQTKNELYPHQQQKIKKIVTHEHFKSGSLQNDIALLYLEKPFSFDENIDIVCLPKNIDDISTSKNCFASGWGKDKFEMDGVYQAILKKVELPMVDSETCQDKLRRTRLGQYYCLHDSFVCAGGVPEVDTCRGDGGSPLVCPVPGVPDKYYQVGIVAWGIGCGTDTPAVYTNVAQFKDWIDTFAKKLNLSNTEYNY